MPLAAIKSDIYSASELCHNGSNQAVKIHLKKPNFCLENGGHLSSQHLLMRKQLSIELH